MTSSNLVTLLSSQSAKSSDPVGSCLTKSYPKVSDRVYTVWNTTKYAKYVFIQQIDVDASDTNLGKVSEFLKKDSYVVLSKKSGKYVVVVVVVVVFGCKPLISLDNCTILTQAVLSGCGQFIGWSLWVGLNLVSFTI